MTYDRKMSIIFWILVAVMVVLVMAPTCVDADEGHGHHHDDGGDVTIDNTLTGGDNIATNTATNSASISGGRAYAFGGSDMDIRDCLATYSMLFGLVQNTKINPFCEALRMDAAGNYQAAAEMRCSTWKYKRVFGKGQACIDAIILSDPPPVIVKATEIVDKDDEDHIEVLYALFSDLETQRNEDVAKAQKATQKANLAAKRANQAEIERKAKAEQAYLDYQEQFIEQD